MRYILQRNYLKCNYYILFLPLKCNIFCNQYKKIVLNIFNISSYDKTIYVVNNSRIMKEFVLVLQQNYKSYYSQSQAQFVLVRVITKYPQIKIRQKIIKFNFAIFFLKLKLIPIILDYILFLFYTKIKIKSYLLTKPQISINFLSQLNIEQTQNQLKLIQQLLLIKQLIKHLIVLKKYPITKKIFVQDHIIRINLKFDYSFQTFKYNVVQNLFQNQYKNKFYSRFQI
eukprot:TRINITY_DN6135_c0_g1_i4.p1 TRINITY_DN6135_c0_g1~~TRINITY_DN6135_c0_g1_i4.p1  ORF type:complete len:240 (-),score=-32.27 TRINITY_DN6135_c0_g1_i4:365-1045(-)